MVSDGVTAKIDSVIPAPRPAFPEKSLIRMFESPKRAKEAHLTGFVLQSLYPSRLHEFDGTNAEESMTNLRVGQPPFEVIIAGEPHPSLEGVPNHQS